MEKLLNSLRAHCLSIFTVSRWRDNPQSQRGGGQQEPLCWVVPCFTSWGPGLSPHPQPRFLLGSHPLPSTERGLLRKAEPGGSSKQEVKGTGATPPGTVSCVCSWRSHLWMEKLGGPGEAAIPPHTSLPATSPPSRLSQSWPHVPKKAMIQDREAEPSGCVIQKGGYRQRDFRNKFNFGFPTFSDHKN